MTEAAHLNLLAHQLWQATKSRIPIHPIAEVNGALTVDDAYRIQTLNIDRLISQGAWIVGHKIGLTSAAMQHMMGVETPDFGHLMDTMQIAIDEHVSLAPFIQPRVEPEIAFLLSKSLPTEGCSAADVLDATAAMAPCIELIDSRIENWQISLIDTISDNASSAAFTIGDWSEIEPGYAGLSVELFVNDDLVESGSTREVLGDPAVAVAWLANELGRFGTVIEAGQVVLSGSCTRAHDVRPGDRARATFGGLGEIAVQFSGESRT